MAVEKGSNQLSARSGRLVQAGLGVAAVAAMIAGGLWWVSSRDGESDEPPAFTNEGPATPKLAEARPAPQAPPREAPDKRLSDAFEAATGHRESYRVAVDGYSVTIRPLRIIDLSFGQALLTEEDSEDACHACVGAVGVYYLRERAGKIEVTGRWPRAVEGWGWGHPPTDWTLTSRFTAYPAIYASGGYLATGIMTSGATITELRPTGPVTSDLIGTDYDDEGTREEGERICAVKGRIANIRKDRSFDVVVTGSVKAVDHYVKRTAGSSPGRRSSGICPVRMPGGRRSKQARTERHGAPAERRS